MRSFAFLGFYIVRKDLRGQGHGLRIWNAAVAHAGTRVIGLDGVVAQQENYKKSGFNLAYANIRYGGIPAALDAPRAGVVALSEVPLAAVEADDATVFPAARSAFLRAWIGAPGHVGRALVRDGRLAAWGVIRPCRTGRKIGPLVADDRAAAEAVLAALLADAGGGEIFLDVPSVNRDAVALAQALGLSPVFETARMYTGPIPPLRLDSACSASPPSSWGSAPVLQIAAGFALEPSARSLSHAQLLELPHVACGFGKQPIRGS